MIVPGQIAQTTKGVSGVFSMDYNVFQYGDDDMQLPSLVGSQKGNMPSVCFVFGIIWPSSLLSHAWRWRH